MCSLHHVVGFLYAIIVGTFPCCFFDAGGGDGGVGKNRKEKNFTRLPYYYHFERTSAKDIFLERSRSA